MAYALDSSLFLSPRSKSPTLSSSILRVHQVPTLKICANFTLRQAILVSRSQKVSKHTTWILRKSHSSVLYHESIHSTQLPPIQAKLVQFKARREVSIPFREGAFPAVEYLNELERVVNVTFPDSARITYLGNSVWRTRLKPVTFFTISATPVCDVKVFNKGSTLQIQSNKLDLEFSGLPEEFMNQTVQFSLQGQLQTNAKRGSQYKAGRQVDFSGGVSLSLRVSLPLPLSLFPETLVTTVGDGILDTIVGAMESALVRGIIADYHSWCWTKQSVESNRVLRVTGST